VKANITLWVGKHEWNIRSHSGYAKQQNQTLDTQNNASEKQNQTLDTQNIIKSKRNQIKDWTTRPINDRSSTNWIWRHLPLVMHLIIKEMWCQFQYLYFTVFVVLTNRFLMAFGNIPRQQTEDRTIMLRFISFSYYLNRLDFHLDIIVHLVSINIPTFQSVAFYTIQSVT